MVTSPRLSEVRVKTVTLPRLFEVGVKEKKNLNAGTSLRLFGGGFKTTQI